MFLYTDLFIENYPLKLKKMFFLEKQKKSIFTPKRTFVFGKKQAIHFVLFKKISKEGRTWCLTHTPSVLFVSF